MALSPRCIWYLVLIGIDIFSFIVILLTFKLRFLFIFQYGNVIIQILNLEKRLEEILFKIIILLLFIKDFLIIIKYKSGNRKKLKKYFNVFFI